MMAGEPTKCLECRGRGWHVGECHPRETCGACSGEGVIRSEGATLAGRDQASQDGRLATPGSVPRARHREAPGNP